MEKRWVLLLALVLLLSVSVVADDGTDHEHPAEGVVESGTFGLKIAAIFLIVASLIAIPLKKHLDNTGKLIVFWTIAVVIMTATLYFGGTIIYENVKSETGGPVHWHADYQIWACGERVDLINPNFPRNKIGSPLFHEHDDDRIHIEGTVLALPDVNLGEYFNIIDGKLEEGHLVYPGVDETINLRNGDTCPNGQQGTLQVYVNGERIEDYENYQIYPDAYVPPGDCIVVEFDSEESETTEKICSSWSAKGWSYDNFERRRAQVGDVVWQ